MVTPHSIESILIREHVCVRVTLPFVIDTLTCLASTVVHDSISAQDLPRRAHSVLRLDQIQLTDKSTALIDRMSRCM
jgi:hypothetical protein